MNNRNVFNNHSNGAPTGANFFDTHLLPTELLRLPTLNLSAHRHTYDRGLISTESGICDEMNNCHLTETWAGFINQETDLPLARMSPEIPILNPYVPLRLPIELQTNSSRIIEATALHHHQNATLENFTRKKSLPSHLEAYGSSLNSYPHPQQKLMREGFSRLDELNYESSQVESHENSITSAYAGGSVMSLPIEYEKRIKTSIKFQDRNKKLDFKVNFRDENRKLDGCFHREDSKSPKALTFAVAPPKKKWIRHYLTGNESAKAVLTC